MTQQDSGLRKTELTEKRSPLPFLLLRCTFCSSWPSYNAPSSSLLCSKSDSAVFTCVKRFLVGLWAHLLIYWLVPLAPLFLWQHILETRSVRDQAVIYSSVCTGDKQGKYRDNRSVTSHFMSSFWSFLNHPFKKVSTEHCCLLVLFSRAWFILMAVCKEETNLQRCYFKEIGKEERWLIDARSFQSQ